MTAPAPGLTAFDGATRAAPVSRAPAISQGGDSNSDQGHGFFDELLDIINPLQHVPVVGTLYRALTGDHLDGLAKVAGDALYGGLWGAVSAVADVAFEAVTGKSAEQTVLAWFDSSDSKTGTPVRVAANMDAPRVPLPAALSLPVLPAVSLPTGLARTELADKNAPPSPALASFTSALAGKGVTGEMASRALYAYRQSVLLTDARGPQPGISVLN